MFKFKKQFKLDRRGFTALLVVLIVGAGALVAAFGASMLGLGELDMGYTAQKGSEVRALADGCAEESLRQLQINQNWAGGTLNLVDGSCIISVLESDNNRDIIIGANVGSYNKKIKLSVNILDDLITVNSWQEIE
jgi:hypothetical protein